MLSCSRNVNRNRYSAARDFKSRWFSGIPLVITLLILPSCTQPRIGDLPFDLYQFKQSEKELDYEGEINGVTTKIRLAFPYPIAHCHEHVWPGE